MTPEAAVALARSKGHVVIVHKGAVFFNTTDEAEAEKWRKLGANLVPHYDDIEIANRRKKGRRTVQGWEVHILGVLAPVIEEDADGDEVVVTAQALLAAARES
jgi:hypothetical protein